MITKSTELCIGIEISTGISKKDNKPFKSVKLHCINEASSQYSSTLVSGHTSITYTFYQADAVHSSLQLSKPTYSSPVFVDLTFLKSKKIINGQETIDFRVQSASLSEKQPVAKAS